MGWLTLVFVVLTVALTLNLWGHVDPVAENPPVAPEYRSTDTVRDPLLVAEYRRKHFDYRCMECHKNFTPTAGAGHLLAEHTDIVLDHGANSECLNCHNQDNWETLRDYEGVVISFASSELLCRKCHGPKYRDWVGGAHGRPNGYWDISQGDSVKTTCVQCHDPHSPKFKPMHPAPAPRDRRQLVEGPAHG